MEPPATAASETAVTRDGLEAHIAAVERGVSQPLAGIFGPDSISWKINRESALFLGAGRAALLQLAHPWVAVALDQHSSLLEKPIARFHNTFRVVFTMVFGSADQAFGASRSLHQLHANIRGEIPIAIAGYKKDSPYEANQIPALSWVFATLVESAIVAYECVLPPLTAQQRNAYFAEARTLAALFGIPDQALPADWNAFTAYIADMCNSQALGVSDRSRYMAHRLLAGSGSRIHPPHWYHAITTDWLPLRFRDEFGLDFNPKVEQAARKAHQWLPRFYTRLPATLRFVGPYQEACARLDHRAPGLMTRRSNQFWIGQPKMPFTEVNR
jgi:uncharacterized protein (DUF2236 family)